MKLGLTDKQYNNLLSLLQEQAEAPAAEPEKGTSDKQAGGQGYPQVGKWESGVTRGPGNQIGITKWADVVGTKLNRGKANPLKEIEYTKRSLLRLINEQSPETEVDPEHVKLMIGAEQPSEPIPAIEKYSDQCKYYAYGECPYENKTNGGDVYYWYYHSVEPTNFWMYSDDLHGAGHGSKPHKLGNYQTNDFVGRLDDMTYYYERELDWWLRANMNTTLDKWKRFHGRISKSGKEVPKGFDPNKYDEYLSKTGLIQQQIDSIDKKHKSNWNPLKSNFGPGGYWDNKELNNYNNLKQQLVNLKNEYSNNEFSYGITKDELEHYNKKIKELNDYYSSKVNEWKEKQNPTTDGGLSITTNVASGTYNNTTSVDDPPELKTIKDEWQKMLDQTDMLFGKDNWIKDVSIFGQSFDKFWDKWGTVISIVGNIAIIAVSGGIAGMVEGAAGAIGFVVESGILRAVAPYAADFTFNSLVGPYEASRGKNENAIISFLCAMVPFVSFEKNIGKASIEVAEGLAKKVAVGKFNSKQSMEIFVRSLTPEERRIFRDVSTLPKESIIANFDKSIEVLSKKMGKAGVTKVAKAGSLVWGPKVLSQLGIEGGVPMAGIIINGFFGIIKDNYGHLYSKEELIQVRQKLNNLKNEDAAELLIKFSEALSNLKQNQSSVELVTKLDVNNAIQDVVDKDLKEITPEQLAIFKGPAKEIINKSKNK